MMENNSNATVVFGQCHPYFNQDMKCDIIFWFRCTIAIFSMLACLFVIFVIVVFKKYKFLQQRLILYLSIGAFFQGLAYAIDDYRRAFQASQGEKGFCVFLGIWTLYFDWFSFLWVCCITFNIFWNAVFVKRTEKFEKFYFIVCIGLPAIICCFPFIENSYGPAGLWCWIRSTSFDAGSDEVTVFVPGVILQFVLFYGPLWTISLILLTVLIYIACLIRQRTRKYHGIYSPQLDAQKSLWEEEIRPLVLFPWIYLFILLFPLMNRLRLAFGFFEPDSAANFFFWFTHACMLTLHGTLYALVFACDKQTRSRITYPQIKAALMQRATRRKKIKEYPLTASTEGGDTLSPVHNSDVYQEDGSSGLAYKLFENQ